MIPTSFRIWFRMALALACLGVVATAQAAPTYQITVLPDGTMPYGINSSGQIVGERWVDGNSQAFLWSGGLLSNLGTLGGAGSVATAINTAGEIVGAAQTASGATHAFRYSNGVMQDLGTQDGGDYSYGSAINDAGHVAGAYLRPDFGYIAFVHSDGQMRGIGTLGGDYSWASGINASGQVVGTSLPELGSAHPSYAFLYSGGQMHSLGSLDGYTSSASAINQAGQVTGTTWAPGGEHAFLYENGVMHDLGALYELQSYGYAINNLGQVVGELTQPGNSPRLAFLYADGVMRDLNTLVDPALGWSIESAVGINDLGQIAALGCRGDQCAALLLQLTPMPEAQTWAMLLAGLGLLGWRRCRAQRSMSMCMMPSSS